MDRDRWKTTLTKLCGKALGRPPIADSARLESVEDLLKTACSFLLDSDYDQLDGDTDLFACIILTTANAMGKFQENCQSFVGCYFGACKVVFQYCASWLKCPMQSSIFTVNKVGSILSGLCEGTTCVDRDDLILCMDKLSQSTFPLPSKKSADIVGESGSLSQMFQKLGHGFAESIHLDLKDDWFFRHSVSQGKDFKSFLKEANISLLTSLDAGTLFVSYILTDPVLSSLEAQAKKYISDAKSKCQLAKSEFDNAVCLLKLVNAVLKLPIFAPRNKEELKELASIAIICLQCSFAITFCYKLCAFGIEGDAGEKKKVFAEYDLEELQRGNTWKAVESSVGILDEVLSILTTSAIHIGCAANNLRVNAVKVILDGLTRLLHEDDVKIDGKKSRKFQSQLRWYEGLNVSLGSFITKLVPLVMSVLNDLKFRDVGTFSTGEAKALTAMDFSSEHNLLDHLLFMYETLKLPMVLWTLFLSLYSRAKSISEALRQSSSAETSDAKKNQGGDSPSARCEDSSGGEEEASVLGHWLETTLATNSTGELDKAAKQSLEEFAKINETCSQSIEILTMLAGVTLDLATKCYSAGVSHSLTKFLEECIDDNFVESLGSVLRQSHLLQTVYRGMESLFTYFPRFLSVIIREEVISKPKLDKLLEILGPSSSSGVPLAFPVNSLTCFVIATVVLKEQATALASGGTGNNERAMWMWQVALEMLEKSALSDVKQQNRDLNKEFCQILLFSWHNFAVDKKAFYLRECIAIIQKISKAKSAKAYLPLFRLLTLFDYMVHCFTKPSLELLNQVADNVLSAKFSEADANKMNDASKWHSAVEGPHLEDADGSSLKIDEKSNQSLTVLLFSLRNSSLNDEVDIEALNILQTSEEENNLAYCDIYDSLVNLTVIITEDLNQVYGGILRSVTNIAAMESTFNLLWKILDALPPAPEDLLDLAMPDKVGGSLKGIVKLLKLGTKFMDKSRNPITITMNVMDILDGSRTPLKDKKIISEKLSANCHSLPYLLEVASHLIDKVSSISQKSLSPLLLCDTCLVFIFNCIKEFKLMDNAAGSTYGETITSLLVKLTAALRTCSDITKKILFSWARKEKGGDQIDYSIYALVIDAGTVPLAKKADIWALAPALPNPLREAIETWQGIKLRQFEVSGDSKDDFLTGQKILINRLLQDQIIPSSLDSARMDPVGILKHSICTLLDFVEFLCISSNVQIEEVSKKELIEVLVGLSTSPVTEPYNDMVNDIMELLVQPLQEDRVQEILQHHILTKCNNILKTDRERASRSPGTEGVLTECLKFIKCVLDKQAGYQYFIEFYSDKTEDFINNVISVGGKEVSSIYFKEVLQIVVKIVKTDLDGKENKVIASLMNFFLRETQSVKHWILKGLTLPMDEEKVDVADAMKLLLEYAVDHRNSKVRILLKHSLDACEEILKGMFTGEGKGDRCLTIAQFIETLPQIALSCGKESHLSLIQRFLGWIKMLGEWFDRGQTHVGNVDALLCAKETCHVILEHINQLVTCIKSVHLESGLEKDGALSSDAASVYQGDLYMIDEADDDESFGEESDDESLCNMLCTFTVTQKEFMNQHWYHCHTCKMNDGVGCCTVCAKICHKDHDVTYAKFGSFFCDCGAKDDGSCKALTKRNPSISERSSVGTEPFSTVSKASGLKGEKPLEIDLDTKLPLFSPRAEDTSPNGFKGKLDFASRGREGLMEMYVQHEKEHLLEFLVESNVIQIMVSLVERLKNFRSAYQTVYSCSFGSSLKLKQMLDDLHSKEKTVQGSDDLLASAGPVGGATDNVRLNFGEEQGQTVRQLISAHVLFHTSLALMRLPKEGSCNLVVCHEKGKITVLQMSGVDRHEDCNEKVTLSQVSTAVVPFTILSVSSNQANEGIIAVSGIKDCHVVTFSNSKSMDSHLALSLQLETGNFVIRTVWLPGSQTSVAVLTADFVKVFDVSVSLTTPEYHFILPSGKVRDATFAHIDGKVSILVMSSLGHIYTQRLDSSASAAAGPFYLTNFLMFSHGMSDSDTGQIWEGGVSVYYSHSLQILLFSYANGKNFIGVLKGDLSGLSQMYPISNGLSSSSALCLWTEVEGNPGLFSCRLQTSGHPAVVMITSDTVLVQEVKSGGRTKLQDAVCFKSPLNSSWNDSHTWPESETVMMYLFEDGTFKISYAESRRMRFWTDQQSSYLRMKMQDSVSKPSKTVSKETPHTPHWTGGTFPIDFFEHCQQNNDVEFGGKDLLHVYNAQQIKQRLNTAGMYIANTKPSGFKVEVTNPNQSNVMAGVRIHVGIRSLESAPKYAEVFGRTVQLHMDRNRWFDIPFTKNEGLTADKKLTIAFGPSSDPSGVSVVDSIKIYTKSKEAFGWVDEQSKQTQRKSESSTTARSSNKSDRVKYRTAINVDSLLSQAVEATCASVRLFPVAVESSAWEGLLKIASYLLTLQLSMPLRQKGSQLLSRVFRLKEEFHRKQDEMQLQHACDVLLSSWEAGSLGSDTLDIDAIYFFLNTSKVVGRFRPRNLVSFVEDAWPDGFVLQHVLKALLAFYAAQPPNPLLAPVYVQGCDGLLNMIECATEVLFAWVLGKPEEMPQITEILMQLLLHEDAAVCFATKRGLAQGLQYHNKYAVFLKSSAAATPTPATEVLPGDRGKGQIVVIEESTPEEPRALTELPGNNNGMLPGREEVEVLDITEEIVEGEDTMPEHELIQDIMRNPDEDAALEMAIALSLQDSESQNEDDSQEGWVTSSQTFPRESSFPSLTRLDIKASAEVKDSDENKENTDEENVGLVKGETVSDSQLDATISSMLSEFTGRLNDLKKYSGMRTIPYLQVLLILCSNVEDSEENREHIRKVVLSCAKELQLTEEEISKFPERSSANEVFLILMRFLSVLMSRRSSGSASQEDKTESQNKESEAKDSTPSFCVQVGNLLVEQDTIPLCFQLLKVLLEYWKEHKSQDQTGSGGGDGTSSLLRVTPRHILLDTSPFFLKQYVKSHANDLFEDFPQLITEMLLRLPYQIWKFFSETKKELFDESWISLLCEYLMVSQAPLIRRQVRKLLLALCGSKEHYRYVKDAYTLSSNIEAVKSILQGVLPVSRVIISYERAVALTDHLRMCLDIATNRTENWQAFCQQDNGVLKFLLEVSCLFSEEIASVAIQLLAQAFVKKKEIVTDGARSRKVQSKDISSKLILNFFSECYGEQLSKFAKYLLLESDSKSLRWKARDLLLILYRNIPSPKQLQLVKLMWNLYQQMPELGRRAEQFVDLLGFCTVKTKVVEAEVDQFAASVVQRLTAVSDQLLNHPNAVLYEELQEIVDLDGYYAESVPCFTCNFPEVMFTNLKLSTVKSDLRYLTTAQLVKLNATYNISKLVLRISDVKRTRMVKVMNVYYNNKAVQSVIELKNKRDMWQLAKRVSLTPAQTDVKVEFSLPIVACNIMIEYSDFYDNLQLSAETLQCPRCSANVLANPGVCSNCGENVYQCHKCRAINYDERDPFLCTSCGFCKYGKFEYTIVAKPCCSVEPIADEEERQKALDTINSLLEQADKTYYQIAAHKTAMVALLGKMELDNGEGTLTSFSKVVQSGSAVTPSVSNNVKKTMQAIASKYCSDCKFAFDEFSKLLQRITALRLELASYDANVENNTATEIPSNPYLSRFPVAQKQLLVGPSLGAQAKTSAGDSGRGVCYGCTLATIEHSLTVLKALALIPSSRQAMLEKGVMKAILQCSAQNKETVRGLCYQLLMILMKDNETATCHFTKLLEEGVDESLREQLDDYRMNYKLQNKFMVLQKSLTMYDSCWEERLRCVFRLFLKVVHFPMPRLFSLYSLPCVKIILDVVRSVAVENTQVPSSSTESKGKLQARKWIAENPHHSFDAWDRADAAAATQSKEYLAEKYGHLWLQKVEEKRKEKEVLSESDTWLSALLFTPFSKELRQAICSVVENICQSQAKRLQVIQILTRYLDYIYKSEDHASEFLSLYKGLISKSEWKWHLATLGILEKIASLLAEHIEYLDHREQSVSLFGLSQGFAVHSLADLLRIFFADEKVRQEYSNKLISQVLQNYLILRRLVLQRTKLVDEAQEILLELIEQSTSGREEEEESFITVCVNVLKQCSPTDIRTPVFLFERICSSIYKEEKEDKEFLLVIEKDSQQEDYLQGRMQGNPYNCKEPGLGPLMRDIKNKICTECELVALLEDDTGMELLVNNKIISLDLPVVDVYKRIWCQKGERHDPMKIVYRMRGLLGDATEDIIENLDNDREKDVDEEHDYRRAAVMKANGGIDLTLSRLSMVTNLSREQKLLSIILKLLEYCAKVKANRCYLSQPSVRSLEIMLDTVNMALRQERDQGANAGGAATAERLLKLMEKILYEASTSDDQPSHVFTPLPVLPDNESQLDVLLGHITSPYVRSNPSLLQAVMKLIPFFSFGSEQSMYSLIDHFLPYLDFERLDAEHSVDEKLYLECFCVIAGGISRSAHGSKLKELINSRGIISRAIEYLKKNIPSKSYRASGILDTAKWKEFLGYPALPYVLRLLTGLATGHAETQDIIGTNENVLIFHMLEQVSSDEMVGSLAENLLEALSEHPAVRDRINAARKETREEKRRMAMKMRQKQLDALGLTVNDTGQIKAKASPLIKEINQVSDEKGLVCCICREGYEFHPNKILGIYTYISRCVLDEFENKTKKTQGYNTVSHFNVVHLDCHSEAVRHACSRDEWESATLQNGSAKCNGILPIWGPKVSESTFATSLARYNSYIQDSTGFREPTLYSVIHDMRLLLLCFAEEKSFSERIGGGGRNSIMYQIPYMAHLALYVLNTTHQRLSEENVLYAFADVKEDKWVESAYDLEGPMFMAVFSWFILPLSVWKTKRLNFMKRLLLLFHVRKISATFCTSLTETNVLDFATYKPACIFFILVDRFHAMFKRKVKTDGDEWAIDMSTKMRNDDEAILRSCEELLKLYERELLPCESFAEFIDVAALHSDVPEPEKFIKDLLISVANSASP